jgi:hypothetical protein
MMLFFKKFQKIGLFLGCFYAFFRVFEAKNTVPKTGLSAEVYTPELARLWRGGAESSIEYQASSIESQATSNQNLLRAYSVVLF